MIARHVIAMNGLRGKEAIANYAYSPCIACDCFIRSIFIAKRLIRNDMVELYLIKLPKHAQWQFNPRGCLQVELTGFQVLNFWVGTSDQVFDDH